MGDGDLAGSNAGTATLPPIASHADDLEVIKRSVEDAASVSGALWVSYLLALFYLAVAVGAVGHADLFLENPVKLPFLNIELQLKAFFFVAPLLFVVIHVYTLTHFVILSNKARWYHDELHRQIAEDTDLDCPASVQARTIRERLQRQLPANIFVQFLAGPEEVRRTSFGVLLKTVAWTTLVIMPVLLLLLMQVQFLPYHSRMITWTTRVALTVDLVIVWWLWHLILLGQGELRQKRRTSSKIGTVAGTLATLAVVFFSWCLATFPGEPVQAALGGWKPFRDIDDNKASVAVSMHDALFHRHIDPTTRRRRIFVSDTLVLPVFDIFSALKVERPKLLDIHRFVFHARGRDLRGAVFDFSNLSDIDFEGAHLEGASLAHAQLQDSSLYCARLQLASLNGSEVQNADFYAADLRGAEMRSAFGEGAKFDGAHLEGAALNAGHFEAASFRSASLQAAGLYEADLTLASFDRASLSGECISDAAFRAQPHRGANLEAAILSGAHLQGASLKGAQLQGTRLGGAALDGADLSNAFLWRADFGAVGTQPRHLTMTGAVWASREGDSSSKAWSAPAYARLVQAVGGIATPDQTPDLVAKRLRVLDCAAPGAASCDPAAAPGLTSARALLEKDASDDAACAASLLATTKTLLCSGDWNAEHVLRGLLANRRLEAAARHGTRLLGDIQKPDCPLSASLSEDDRNKLVGLKRRLAAQGVGE